MSSSGYDCNVGEVVLRKDECFWLLPIKQLFNEEDTYSPWFSYLGVKWRLMKEYEIINSTSYITFRLRRKNGCNLFKNNHIVRLRLRTRCEKEVIEQTGKSDSDYGCEFRFKTRCICVRYNLITHIFSQNGAVKISFDIQKENINDANEEVDEEDKVEENETDEYEESSAEENDEVSNDEDCSKNKNATAELKGVKKLAEDLKQVLFDKELSDILLIVEEREFNVHKVILAARSPVFASMFKHDLTENKTNEVNIPDCTAESFEVFLDYLYSGSIDNVSKSNVWNLYYAADKYQVNDLKKKCVKVMIKNLSVETVCDAIALALRHGESKLQKEATSFFSENIKKILKSVQWQKYMIENPTHANELLIKALNA